MTLPIQATHQPSSPPVVELVFLTGCPHVAAARERLRDAMGVAGQHAEWVEWDVLLPITPARYRGHPSPTILVAGRDILGDTDPGAPSCRVGGAPPTAVILEALRGSAG